MIGPPLRDGVEPLALAQNVRQVDVSQPDDAQRGRLDHRHHGACRVDHRLALSDARQRLPVVVIPFDKPARSRLTAGQDCGHQLVAQRAGEAELSGPEIFEWHQARLTDTWRTDRRLPQIAQIPAKCQARSCAAVATREEAGWWIRTSGRWSDSTAAERRSTPRCWRPRAGSWSRRWPSLPAAFVRARTRRSRR